MSERYERNMGRLVELKPGGSQDVLDLQWRDEVARVICVTLVGSAAKKGLVFNPAACVAFVQWGAGEAEAEAEIDYGVGGVVFTLPASSIRIKAAYDTNTGATVSTNPTVLIGAFACVGSGDRHSRLTRTRYVDAAIAAAGTMLFEVPAFAKAVRVMAGDSASRAYSLDFFGDVTPGPIYTVHVPAGVDAPLFDLAPDVVSVRFTNTGGSAIPKGTRAIFELGI